MTLFRSDAEVAVDEVTIACKQAALRLTDIADLAAEDAPDLEALLRDLAAGWAALSTDLEQVVLDLGGLPGAPDDDREVLEEAVRHLRDALAGERRTLLVEDARAAGDAVAEALRPAQAPEVAEALPPAARATLDAVAAQVDTGRQRLDAFGPD